MMNFTNVEGMFYDYLLSRGYAPGTAKDYVYRLRKIESADTLISKDLNPCIEDYEIGAHAAINQRTHKAYSNALKRLQEMQRDKGMGPL